MLNLSKLNQYLPKDQPLDKNTILDRYREMLEKLEHMSKVVEGLKKDTEKEMKELETTEFSDKKISRAYEFFGFAAEMCDDENYDVMKTYDKFDRDLKKEFLPCRKFVEKVKEYAEQRGFSVKETVYPHQISTTDHIDIIIAKGDTRAWADMKESYEKCAQRILPHLHDKTAEDRAFREIADELEKAFEEIED